MIYTDVILKGFKRFALNQISYFRIQPSEQVQLILGTNGSGKSSLMQELTPLPANPADYLKDGSKEIHIAHRGSNYVLTSTFSSGNKHSFKKDGEELNPGGTAAVQKELCRQEFGINGDTHELSTGSVRFTAMGPALRRQWFTELSDVDYDYAIGVYDKLRKEHRSVVGAIDFDKRQLVLEQSKIITEQEQQQLVNDVKQLHTDLTRLLELRAPIERPLTDVQSARSRKEQELHELSMRLLNLRVESPAHMYRDDWGELQPLVFNSLDEVQAYIDELREQIAAQEAVMGKMIADHGKLKETVEILKRQGADGIESVRKKIALVVEQRLTHMKAQRLQLDFAGLDPFAAKQILESIKHDLTDVLNALPSNEDKHFSSATLAQLKQSALALKETINQKRAALAQAQGRKQHADEHRASGSITCPKCNHVFTKGLSEEQYESLKKSMALIGQEIAGSEQSLQKLEVLIGEQENYGTLYRQFIQLTRSSPALRPFWDHVVEKELIVQAPRSVLNLVQVLEHDLQHECQVKTLNDEIEELKKLLAQSEQLGDQNINDAQQKLNNVALEIEAITKTLAQAKKDLTDFYTYRKQLAEAIALEARIREAGAHFEQLTHETVETLRRQTIQQCIQQTQSMLARKEEILNGVKQQKAIVENLTKTLGERAKVEEALRHVVRELSPTDGLIAEGLLGFIKNYTHQMNQLIRKIWAYPLEVMPCGISNEKGAELDYKFPLMVGERDNLIADVSRGSSGMQEIIDLAYKVVALKYKHLEDGPLMLDEFGKTLDLEHRSAAVTAIKNLMETKPFTQLFMISHYEAHYGAFSNAEVCVLDARNIAVPKAYNQHVIMQ